LNFAVIHHWWQRKHSVWLYVAFVSFFAGTWLVVIDAGPDFTRLWDFRVYLRAKEAMLQTGSPYFERESLRFIYPPSSIQFLNLINETPLFQSIYFVFMGTLWFATAALFCRQNVHLLLVFPLFLSLFGMHGYVTVLTGNIAPALYSVAALSLLIYLRKQLSMVGFSLIILALTLVKPFYAEFLIAIWFVAGFRRFVLASVFITSLFFVINLLFYPDLFFEFLSSLKVANYDTEIFGITMFSHLISLGLAGSFALLIHAMLIGLLLILFIQRFSDMSYLAQFCGIFILATLINPKHVTYDLLVMVPPLIVFLFEGRRWVLIAGVAILLVASQVDLNMAHKPYYQWWYATVVVFLAATLARKPASSFASLPNWIWTPAR